MYKFSRLSTSKGIIKKYCLKKKLIGLVFFLFLVSTHREDECFHWLDSVGKSWPDCFGLILHCNRANKWNYKTWLLDHQDKCLKAFKLFWVNTVNLSYSCARAKGSQYMCKHTQCGSNPSFNRGGSLRHNFTAFHLFLKETKTPAWPHPVILCWAQEGLQNERLFTLTTIWFSPLFLLIRPSNCRNVDDPPRVCEHGT